MDGFGRAFMNPPLLWILVFRHLVAPYGLFLIPTAIVERKLVFKPLLLVAQKVRAGEEVGFLAAGGKKTAADTDADSFGRAMISPYVNVVRMHLLIFFFAICYALRVQAFIVFAAVYFVYFFPWSDIKKQRALKKAG